MTSNYKIVYVVHLRAVKCCLFALTHGVYFVVQCVFRLLPGCLVTVLFRSLTANFHKTCASAQQ